MDALGVFAGCGCPFAGLSRAFRAVAVAAAGIRLVLVVPVVLVPSFASTGTDDQVCYIITCAEYSFPFTDKVRGRIALYLKTVYIYLKPRTWILRSTLTCMG